MSANTYLSICPVIPNSLLISNITKSNPMVVTVTASNSYVVGQLAHLNVPYPYGMLQADQLTGQITEIDGLDFSLNIDSSGFDTFVTPSGNVPEPASLAPAGSRNLYNNTTVPFHSEGNFGN